MIRETTALAPLPNINATRLKSNIPTSNHTSAPIITSENAIIEVIFITFPRDLSICNREKVMREFGFIIKRRFRGLVYQSLWAR